MRSRAANALCLSRFRKLYAALVRPARSLGSFHVAGNFTLIYDAGMNPLAHAPTEERTRE